MDSKATSRWIPRVLHERDIEDEEEEVLHILELARSVNASLDSSIRNVDSSLRNGYPHEVSDVGALPSLSVSTIAMSENDATQSTGTTREVL